MSRMPTPLRSEIGAPLRIEIAAIKGARFAKGMEISEVRPAAIAIWLGEDPSHRPTDRGALGQLKLPASS